MAIPGTSRTLWKAHGFAREEAAVKMIEAVPPYGAGLR